MSTKHGRILRYVKNDVKSVAKLPDYWNVNREDPGTRLWLVHGRTFHLFQEWEMGELFAKSIAKTAKDNSTDDTCCSPEQPFIS